MNKAVPFFLLFFLLKSWAVVAADSSESDRVVAAVHFSDYKDSMSPPGIYMARQNATVADARKYLREYFEPTLGKTIKIFHHGNIMDDQALLLNPSTIYDLHFYYVIVTIDE